jgi:membrane protease YdiL (CAAX protease family)
MNTIRTAFVRWPIPAYIVIAFAFSWAFTLLVSISILFGLLALFGPAIAAIVVTRAEGTWPALRARIVAWRQPVLWYVVAFGTPVVVAAMARAIHVVTGGPSLGFGAISAIELVIFVLVVGEEIGWRGFLQPRLRETMSLGRAGLATGVVWTLWHLPIYLQPSTGLTAFAVFAWWVLPLAIAIGFVGERARFSVLVTTVMHGAANIATPILLPDVDTQWTQLVTGAGYWLIAATVVAWDAEHRPAAGWSGHAR